MVVPTEDNAVSLCAGAPLSKSSRVYMIYFQNNTPTGAELAAAKPWHPDLRPNASSVARHERVAEVLCYGVLPGHYSVSSSMRRDLRRFALIENCRDIRSRRNDAVLSAMTSWLSSVAAILSTQYLTPKSCSSFAVPESKSEISVGLGFGTSCGTSFHF